MLTMDMSEQNIHLNQKMALMALLTIQEMFLLEMKQMASLK